MTASTDQPARGASPLLAEVGPAFVVVLGVLVAVAELAGVVGWRPLAARGPSAGMLFGAVVVAGVFVAVGRRHSRPRRMPVARVWGLLPLVPAAVLLGYAVQRQFLPRGTRVEWFVSGDHVRHLLSVADERVTGSLTYAHQVYPRAWHTLVTAMWSASGAQPDAAGFVSLVDQMSTAVWLLAALLALVTARLGAVLARRCGLSPAGVGVAGLVAGTLVLLPSFFQNYMALGFETSLLAAVLLAVVATEVLERPGTRSALVVCATSAALMAHTWQLLMPPVAVGVAVCAVTLIRSSPVAGLVWTLVVGAASLAVAAPGLRSVVSSVGIGHASQVGVVASLPTVLLPMTVLATLAAGCRWRTDWRVLACAALVLLPALTGLTLAARVGVAPTQYYPSKLIWHTVALGLAPLGVLTAWGMTALYERSSAAAAAGRTVSTAGLVVVMVYAFAMPVAAQLHKWATVDGATVLTAVTTPGAPSAQVVWLGRGYADDTIVRILLDYYRVGQTLLRTPQEPLRVEEECQLLRQSAAPTVLSNQPAAAVASRYSCVPAPRVVRVTAGQGR